MNSQNNYAKLAGLGNLTISTIALSYISFAPSCLQAHLFIVAMTKEHRSETMESLFLLREAEESMLVKDKSAEMKRKMRKEGKRDEFSRAAV